MTKKLLGYCGVDSGQLIVVDPCYLREWKDGEAGANDGNSYATACEITCNDEMGGEILVSGIGGSGVVFTSGWGDGSYPVYATYGKDGRISKIEIRF